VNKINMKDSKVCRHQATDGYVIVSAAHWGTETVEPWFDALGLSYAAVAFDKVIEKVVDEQFHSYSFDSHS